MVRESLHIFNYEPFHIFDYVTIISEIGQYVPKELMLSFSGSFLCLIML